MAVTARNDGKVNRLRHGQGVEILTAGPKAVQLQGMNLSAEQPQEFTQQPPVQSLTGAFLVPHRMIQND